MTSRKREGALPVGATPTLTGNGWSVRLPVRAEEISLSKQVVVRERVLVRRQQVQEHACVKARVLREELRAAESGLVNVRGEDTEQIPTNPARN